MQDDFIKITNTVYRVLDFLPDGDPLKNKAKEKVLEILEGLALTFSSGGWVSLRNYFSIDRAIVLKKLSDNLEILESYLILAKHQGWISGINFLIITKECKKVKQQIEFKKEDEKIRTEILKVSKEQQITKVITQKKPSKKERSSYPLKQEILLKGDNYSDRQQKILKILGVREKTQVSDIIKEIPDITKRTIRRDLDDLLKNGRVARSGEWNRVFYTISG